MRRKVLGESLADLLDRGEQALGVAVAVADLFP
jgi:hypothetical protein